jgi:hypothetical protein
VERAVQGGSRRIGQWITVGGGGNAPLRLGFGGFVAGDYRDHGVTMGTAVVRRGVGAPPQPRMTSGRGCRGAASRG